VEVRLIPHRPAMDITLDDVKPLIDARTHIVSLASANFLSGYPIDLGAIGQWLHQRDVLFCVDAIQTLGAVRLDAAHVDFICADSHKWMLGPNGIALLWARHGALEQLRPAILGWLATKDRDNWYAYDTTPIDSGERFEPGARNHLGVVGFEASLAILEEAGAEFVERRVTQLRDYTAKRLNEIGCRLLWEPDPALPSGIVSFRREGIAMPDLFKHLDAEFALAMRQDRAGADWIRVSAHFMNTEEDIDRLMANIETFRSG
jgi:cysteine desulfurase/selenocysteine lyase